ncbi:lysophospholipid acyltransferase family protein [Campylobacter curvus]|uniref:lysophospholipid acyltransferase family protein n=1 Tax=Campylobacter curvus TaxID=200 RepID=UPI001B8CA0D8|nr:lysophospholipid acyltransferase family protein [Campylobacter curvus]
MFKEVMSKILDFILCNITIFITGIRPQNLKNLTDFTPKIYYANHTSHGDFLLLFVSMPYALRKKIRPVAGADYWSRGKIRPFLAKNVFNMLLIGRNSHDPLTFIEQMSEALKTHSLIIFPEGTRKMNDDLPLQPFKSGIYHLAKQNPNLKLVPIWINNMHNVLPKGFFVPIPLLCELCVGEEFGYEAQDRVQFLKDAASRLLALKKDAR